MNEWFEQLKDDPTEAVRNLMSGVSGVSFEQLDMPERLYQELPDTPEYQEKRALLGCGLYNWLAEIFFNRADAIEKLGLKVYSLRVCKVLNTIKLLNLTREISMLSDTPITILAWLNTLDCGPDRNPAAIYKSMIKNSAIVD